MSQRVLDINNTEFLPLARQILSEGNSLRFRAHGYSMRPFIKDNDILLVQPLSSTILQRGDIILFADHNNGLLAHRVIRITNKHDHISIVTQGDANRVADHPISIDQVLGVVIIIERHEKRIQLNKPIQRNIARLWLTIAPPLKKSYFFLRNNIIYCKIRPLFGPQHQK